MYRFLLLIAALLPFQFALNPWSGADLPVGRVLIALAGLVWISAALFGRRVIGGGSVGLFLVLLGGSIFISGAVAIDPVRYGRKLLFLLGFFPFFFFVLYCLRSAGQVRKFLEVSVLSGAAAALAGVIFSFAQFYYGADRLLSFWSDFIAPIFLGKNLAQMVSGYSSAFVAVGGENYLRAAAFFPDPHIFSFYAEMLLPPAAALAWLSRGRKKTLFAGATGAFLLAVALTFTRGAYVAVVVSFLIWGLWIWRKKIDLRQAVRFGALFLLLVTIVRLSPVGERFLAISPQADSSISERWEIWRQALDLIAANPLSGVGLGNYSLAVNPLAEYRTPYYAHNLYLDIAVEAGLPALLFLILLLAIAWRNLFRSGDPLAVSVGIGLIAFAVHSLADTALFSVHILPLLLAFLALAALPRKIWTRKLL